MRIAAALVIVLGLSGCAGGGFGSGGGSTSIGSLNPFGWFGGRKKADAAETLAPRGGYVQDIDFRSSVDQITALNAEKTADGVILRAVGLPPTQAYYDAELVPVASDSATRLDFEFRISPPLQRPRVGTAFSREVYVATFLSQQDLRGIREVRVIGLRNSRSTRP